MSRMLVRLGIALAVLLAALVLLFPTDAVVRRVLARYTPAGAAAPAFEEAHLGPRGIVLRKVTLARPTGPVVVSADRVDLRPSILGVLTGNGGHPWVFDADICGGTAKGTVALEGAATVADAEFENADLAVCPLLELGGAALSGRGRGNVHLRLEPVAPAHGNGQLELSEVAWRGQGVLAIFRAHSASGSWRLEERKLTLASIDVKLAASVIRGAGEVSLAEPLPDSTLRLALTMGPADGSEPAPDPRRRHAREAGARRTRVMRKTRGLTLLEVVVAVAVLAVGVVALQRLVGRSVAVVADDARLTRAMLAARALLAETALVTPEPGHDEGTRDGLRFERDVRPTPHPALREVRVRVGDGPRDRGACELVEVIRVRAP